MKLSLSFRKLLLALLVITSLLLALAILGDWLPSLRGPAPQTSEWYWPYLLRPAVRWWPSLVSAFFLLAIAGWWLYLSHPTRRQTILALVAIFSGTFVLQLTLVYADREDITAELVDRTLSNQASGFFEAAAEIDDMRQTLINYPIEMVNFSSEHARTHPPGLILANWLTIKLLSHFDDAAQNIASLVRPARCIDLWLLDRPAAVSAALGAWAILPLLFAASSVFPAYALGRQLLTGVSVRMATLLASLVPALLLFSPKSVQLYAPLALLLFWAFHCGLVGQSAWKLLLAGLILSLLSFLSLGNAALALPLFLYALLSVFILPRRGFSLILWPQKLSVIAGQLVSFAVGAASLWLILWLVWGVPPWDISAAALDQHYELVTNLRSYQWWVNWNLIDLAVFAGWPLVVGFAGSLFLVWRSWQIKRLAAVDILAVSLVVLILVLNFSGTARGEVGRLWLFFMPLMAYPSSRLWTTALFKKRELVLVVSLQLLLVLCLGWAWRPVRAVIVVAEEPTMASAVPQYELDGTFADEPIRLDGFSVSPTPVAAGESITLTLFWRAGGPASRPYTVFNHLVSENDNLAAQQDGWPVNGSWPPTCWRNGDVIVDTYQLQLPPDLEPGTYRLLTGLYDARNDTRLLYEDGRDALEIVRVPVVP